MEEVSAHLDIILANILVLLEFIDVFVDFLRLPLI